MTTPTVTITSMITTVTAEMAGMNVVPVDVSNKDCGMSQNEQNLILMRTEHGMHTWNALFN